jgi:hypothetical protein
LSGTNALFFNYFIIHLRKKFIGPDKGQEGLAAMDVPVLNRGAYLYTAKLNVTRAEGDWILNQKWHKLKGQPWSKNFGYLFDLVAAWRKPDEVLYPVEGLVPLTRLGKCVAYAQVDPEDHHDLMRFEWMVDPEGYAQFRNRILGVNISMHRYLMDFPEGLVVDHVKWNRLDNRRSMLRPCTVADNNRNMSYTRVIE